MFSPDIVCSDEFLDMPVSSRDLYFQLSMRADDDGFVQPKTIMRVLGASQDDLKVLIAKRFILPFESGVVVVKHWLIHNMIRADRYKPSRFHSEKSTLLIRKDKVYTDNPKSGEPILATKWQPNGNQSAPQIRIDQDRSISVPQKIEIVKDEPTKPKRTLPVAEVVFGIFKEEFGKYPLNWKTNRTQRIAAENLWKERGEAQIRKALRFHRENKDEPYCPTITSPWDLDSKWLKLHNANKKQNGN